MPSVGGHTVSLGGLAFVPLIVTLTFPSPFSQDLEEHPNNGWSLLGLAHVLNANQDRDIDALQRFRKAWQHAEVEIESSCPALSRAYLI